MNTTKLVVLGLVFLSAILIHMLLIQKEGFDTRINQTNVKRLFIDSMQELIAHYNTLKDAPANIQADKRFKRQRILLANFINDINSKYFQYEYAIDNYNYDNANSLTFEELNRLKQFLSYKVNDIYTSLIEPASANDLAMITNRLSNITTTIISNDIMNIPGASTMFSWINATNADIQTKFSNLKRTYESLSDTNKPILKSQLYITFLLDANDNFNLTKYENSTIPLLQIENIPVSFTSSGAISSTTTSGATNTSNILSTSYGTSNIATVSSSNVVPTGSNITPISSSWSSDRLKSLFFSLSSYEPTKKSKKDDTEYDTSYSDYATLDEVRDIVDEELEAKLRKIKKGYKDKTNDKLSERTTTTDSTKETTFSDSLAQGMWFRTASEECPYAYSQDPVPFPIDMSEYIRKDSIPCWGCTLK